MRMSLGIQVHLKQQWLVPQKKQNKLSNCFPDFTAALDLSRIDDIFIQCSCAMPCFFAKKTQSRTVVNPPDWHLLSRRVACRNFAPF